MTATEMMARSKSDKPRQQSSKDAQQELIMEILRFEGEVPVRIVELVNRAATWINHDSRNDRERAKLAYFRLIGDMIRVGKLRRFARNYVLIALPRQDCQEQERQLALTELPMPSV